MLLLLLSILPVFLIGLFVYLKDRNKESLKLLFKLLLFGALSCIPVIIFGPFFELFFPSDENMNIITLFLYVLIRIAFVEEICKFFMVYVGSFNHHEFDNLYDMIIYATFVSLGFALVENILYVLVNGYAVGILRALSAVPGHAGYGIMMGYYLGLAKISLFNNNSVLYKKNLIYSIIIPVIMHTIYDFCLFSNSLLLVLFFFLYVIFIYVICLRKVFHVSRNSGNYLLKSNFCIKCGRKVDSRFCPLCGNENK